MPTPETIKQPEVPTARDSVQEPVSPELFEALRSWTATIENMLLPDRDATPRTLRLYEQLGKYGCEIRQTCPEARRANKQMTKPCED